MKKVNFCLLLIFCLFATYSKAQSTDSVFSNIENFPGKYFSKVDKKISSINDRLSKKSAKYLSKFELRDSKIRKKLRKLNPDNLIVSGDEKFDELFKKVKNPLSSRGFRRIKGLLPNKSPPANSDSINHELTGEYNPYLDSLSTSLSFLKQFNGIGDKAKEPLASFHSLQSNLQQSEKIKAFIAERRNQLKEALSKYTKIPPGLKSQYDKLSKTVYYYSAQVKEYKDMLKDPEKIERKALSLLNKLPVFQKFMKENGQLASLFHLNENLDPAQSLSGLQSRTLVQGIIQQRIGNGGPNAMQIVQQNIAQAMGDMNKLKDKILQLGGGGSDVQIPDFKPNTQKTKSFLRRLEYSANVQFIKSSNLLPSGSNIGLGIGYKLNDKRSLGFGMSYKVGFGTIRNLSISSQGLGLRSYFEWKIKKEIYASGGYEMNYNSIFKNIQELKYYEAWQRSALIGLSRKYRINKKMQGEIKLLYDFLANRHIPVTQSILFRVGYNFSKH